MVRSLVLFAAACQVPTAGDQNPPPPYGLQLSAQPFIAGELAEIRAEGAAAGERIYLGVSRQTSGAGPCIAAAGGLCLDIPDPVVLIGSSVADASGVALWTPRLPASLPIGSPLSLQAVAVRGIGGAGSVASNPWVASVTTSGAAVSLAQLGPGDLVVSEMMRNPAAVADAQGEWLEIYNASGVDVELLGLEIRDLGTDSWTVASSLVLPAGDVVVFGAESELALNGGVPVDLEYTNTTLANGIDEVVLAWGNTIFDEILLDNSWPRPTGASIHLDPTRIGDGANIDAWCVSTMPYGDGDLGTPNELNPLGTTPVTESFTQGAAVDVLVAMDFSGSMQDELAQLVSAFPLLIQEFDARGVDYNIAVTSADGQCPEFLGPIITPATPDAQTEFANQIATAGCVGEEAFSSTVAALTPPLSNGANAGFIRSDANLAVIVASDEDEQSPGGAGIGCNTILLNDCLPVADYIDDLAALKGGDASRVSFSGVVHPEQVGLFDLNCVGGLGAPRYHRAINRTGGVWGDLCNLDAPAFFTDFSDLVGVQSAFTLAADAQGTITVEVGGTSVPEDATNGFTYNSATRTVSLHGSAIPVFGTPVEITYTIGGSCSQ